MLYAYVSANCPASGEFDARVAEQVRPNCAKQGLPN
jgi:hypothetical protein